MNYINQAIYSVGPVYVRWGQLKGHRGLNEAQYLRAGITAACSFVMLEKKTAIKRQMMVTNAEEAFSVV